MSAPGLRPAPPADEATWQHRWEEALASFEVDLVAAEELLRVAHLPGVAEVAELSSWHPPADLGPLPAPLLARAQAVLERQIEVAGLIAQAAASSRRQMATTRALRARPEAVPVYLDAQG
ncbi:MAG: hypothetical protein NVV70_16225 [Cellulomonas sp.]|uniref:hypothetical protein n=1 Tax=unclassified Cellulomonas TaxID=2620175 RepID=UPI0006527281|nr:MULTISPECIES: hypothetical protein [unclassified Cellulomonas]KMM46909.1 hypothetical protein CWIS_02720 [Cellulomonas sp. A375-1]MCR6649599.1 hypothetical protein [Cellulomonas sp.]MCR6705570.1 hypothetical protein [Cellulomonas sp.]